MTAGKFIFRGLLAFLGAGCAIGLTRIAATIFLRVPLDPNEGWNAYHSLAAMSGSALYPPPNGFVVNNYPPLSYYIVGAFGKLVGDYIIAGRLLSFTMALGTAGGIYASLRAMTVDPWRALFAALLFVAGLLIFTDYVGMDDPQLLAHAVAICGLVLLLKKQAASGVEIAVALLMMLALFVKHNLIALPIAVSLWLALYDGRSAARFVISGLVFALIGLAVFHLAYGIGLIGQLNSPRRWSSDGFMESLTQFLVWSGVSLFGLAALLFLGRSDKHVAFCAIYAAASIIIGAAFAGGAGVDMNIWFDAAIALALSGGLLLQKLGDRNRTYVGVSFAYGLPLLAGLALNWNSDWLTRDYWSLPLAEETANAEVDITFLKLHDGPALCEMLSLCYWAGKREQVDVFNLGQAYATHRQSDTALVRLIDAHYFRAIGFDTLDDFALGKSVRQAVMRAYRVDHSDENGVFLLPR